VSEPNARILIVGAGQAGGRAAEALRATGHRGPVTLLGEERHPPYERPQLSKAVLLDEVAAPAFMRADADWAALGVELIVGAAVVDGDLGRRRPRVRVRQAADRNRDPPAPAANVG
jgi:p-cumate 2,3-dioxygenase ferredoxin reductase subunit